MKDPDAAWRTLMDCLSPLPAGARALDACLHHYLAQPVCADRDMPAADRAAMDGYAVRAADAALAPATLRVVGEVAAGSAARPALAPSECVRILTGANVPPDADAVIMVEDTTSPDDNTVTLLKPVTPGQHILRQGENARQGEVLLPAGAALDATTLAVCAAAGCVDLHVHARPRIAVITTGAELKQAGEPVGLHEIRDSNGPMLVAAVAGHGFGPAARVRVADDRVSLLAALRQALESSEAVLVTGGVSVGKYDLVPDAVREVGATVHYHGLAIKPGKPQLFATVGNNRYIFGLPGNPQAVLVGFHEFALPALRRLAGCPEADCRPLLRLPLQAEVRTKGPRQHYLPARMVHGGAGTAAEPIANAGSADLVAGSKAQGTIIVPAGVSRLATGTIVEYRPWRLP